MQVSDPQRKQRRTTMTFKKFALITALLIGTITGAAAGPYSQDFQIDRAVDVGENGGGGS
jgi:hypothetical protein